jgi:hypothetical protein
LDIRKFALLIIVTVRTLAGSLGVVVFELEEPEEPEELDEFDEPEEDEDDAEDVFSASSVAMWLDAASSVD